MISQVFKRFAAGRGLAASNLAVAAVIALGVFGGLPVRPAAVAVAAVVLIALLVASSAGLFWRARWEPAVTRVAGFALFWAGLLALGGLALGMAFGRAVAGRPVGPPVSVLALAALLVAPYTVVYGLVLVVRRPPPGGKSAA